MNTPKIHPLSNHLLLDVTPQEQTTAAGIVLPTAVQGASTRMEGTIVARGPDCARTDLSAGTRVYVSRYASGDLPRGERSYKLAVEADVIAILD
ncbi:co-chaperone GroES family protein [Prosthecobacter sp.]|uniref:co-chaperone GroES family protein n=1 Tax=Prosthecobacter sp. TaxID=1965333 RepID=UPI0037843C21